MIRISNLSLPVDGDLEQLRKRAARALGLRPGQLGELEIVRQSIDARNRSEVHYVYTVELSMPQEERLVENAPGRNVSRTERQAYAFPTAGRRSALPPVVVGMGPAGLFAALFPVSCWSGARTWTSGPGTWTASGPPGPWTRAPTSSSEREGLALFPTES